MKIIYLQGMEQVKESKRNISESPKTASWESPFIASVHAKLFPPAAASMRKACEFGIVFLLRDENA
jgi:hypothetical protein